MIWTMPRRLVQAAGAALALSALAAFTLGVVNAPERGRLPGERPGKGQAGSLIQATEATPLVQERIEAPPPPPKPEEQADDEDQPTAATNAPAAATNATPAAPAAAPPAQGPIPQETAPPPEEPPH
jgi:hypothetical protein